MAGLDLRQIEDVIDQLQQVPAAGEDVPDVALLPLVEISEGMVFQQLGESDDRVQRGPQLVTHAGQEVTLGPVGRLGRLAGLLLLRHQAALGDVPAHTGHPRRLAVAVAVDLAPGGEDSLGAIGPHDPVFRIIRGVALDRGRGFLRDALPVGKVHQGQEVFIRHG